MDIDIKWIQQIQGVIMDINLRNHINNISIPSRTPLDLVYEAISNSVNAIGQENAKNI